MQIWASAGWKWLNRSAAHLAHAREAERSVDASSVDRSQLEAAVGESTGGRGDGLLPRSISNRGCSGRSMEQRGRGVERAVDGEPGEGALGHGAARKRWPTTRGDQARRPRACVDLDSDSAGSGVGWLLILPIETKATAAAWGMGQRRRRGAIRFPEPDLDVGRSIRCFSTWIWSLARWCRSWRQRRVPVKKNERERLRRERERSTGEETKSKGKGRRELLLFVAASMALAGGR